MSIGNNIRKVRKQKNMTLQQLADILGCSQQNISQYETGKRKPKYDTLKKIIHALDVPLLEIVGEDELEIMVTAYMREEAMQEVTIIPKDEVFLMHDYKKLNDIGKQEARKRVNELTEIPRYIQKEKNLPDKKE